MPPEAVRRLQQLDQLVNAVVRDAELIHDYVQLSFHGDSALTLNNTVKLDGQPLSNSPSGRTLLASLVGRAVIDVARDADELVVNFRGGPALTMSLKPPAWPYLWHRRERRAVRRSVVDRPW